MGLGHNLIPGNAPDGASSDFVVGMPADLQLSRLTAKLWKADEPHVLLPETFTLPDRVPMLTVMAAVPCPAVIVAPAGTDQLYVTPATAVVLYFNPAARGQTEVGPMIAAGTAGFELIVMLFAALLVAQDVPAVTDILP